MSVPYIILINTHLETLSLYFYPKEFCSTEFDSGEISWWAQSLPLTVTHPFGDNAQSCSSSGFWLMMFNVALHPQRLYRVLLLGTGSPGYPPLLSHGSQALTTFNHSLFLYIHTDHTDYYSIRDGVPRMATLTFTQLLNSSIRLLINLIYRSILNCRGWLGTKTAKANCHQKPNLSTIERGYQMDGWPLCARLCPHPGISPQSHSVQTLQKSFGGPSVHAWKKKDHICTSKNLKSMSEFDGLWKLQHNPASTKSARVFIKLTLNTKTSKSKKKKVDFRKHTDSLKIKISSYHSICIYYIMYTLRKLHSEKTAHCKLLQSGYHRQ